MNNFLKVQVKTADDLLLLPLSEVVYAPQGIDLSPPSLTNETLTRLAKEALKLSVLTVLVFLLAACNSTGNNAGFSAYPQSNFASIQSSGSNVTKKSVTSDPASTKSNQLANPQSVLCAAEPAVVQQALLQLVNESRKESRMCGADKFKPVPAITLHSTLQSIAKDHSLDMATNNFFSHTGSDGLTVLERAAASGYNWQHISENIAAGHVTTGEVHAGWLASPGHCVNIMAAEVTEFGAACISNDSSENKRYWSTAFGKQRDFL